MAGAIFKQTFLFTLYGKDEQDKPLLKKKQRVGKSAEPQGVDDWVTQTRLFKSGVANGTIIELKGSGPKPKEAADPMGPITSVDTLPKESGFSQQPAATNKAGKKTK